MKNIVPIATVVIGLMLLYDSMPRFVITVVTLILVVLVMSRWSILGTYFQQKEDK